MSNYFFPREQEDVSQETPLRKIMIWSAWLLVPCGVLTKQQLLYVTVTLEELFEK